MSSALLAARVSAGGGILRRDWLLFRSYRFRLVSQLLQVLMSLTLFYYVSRLVSLPDLSPDEYFANVVIGLVILEMLTATMVTVPVSIRQELVAGTFERILVSPFGAVEAIMAMAVFPFLMSAGLGVVTVTVAAVLFGLHIEWATAAAALPVAALGSLAFAPFVLMITGAVLLVKQVGAGAGFAVTAISLLGGFFFPPSLLPDWLRWTADVQPFTPALELMRHLVVGTPLTQPAGLALLKLVGFAAVLTPAAIWILAAAIGRSRARGTIIEY